MRPLTRMTLVSRLDSPGGTHGLDAFARHNFGIETLQIDAARHHRDSVPGRAVAIIDELRDLLARRNDAIAARHDAVIVMFEEILFPETLVPTGHKLGAVQTSSNQSAPCAGAAERVNHLATSLSRKPTQNEAHCAR